MTAHDTVLAGLDAEIASLEADLAKVREMRKWWVERRTPGSSAVDPSILHPRLRSLPEYVRYVLRDGRARLPIEIVDEARALGWTTDSPRADQLVRNALHDLGDEVTVVNRRYSLVVPVIDEAR